MASVRGGEITLYIDLGGLHILSSFSLGGSPTKAKVLVLGPISSVSADRSRSLNLEHVSSADMIKQEISRQTLIGFRASQALDRGCLVPDQTMLSIMRRWFWTRKPDAGFVLADFPATLLQGQVFEEWLDTRGVTLTACAIGDEALVSVAVLDHFRTHGVAICDVETLFAA
ncbi:MAG: nucleoside monophosphate kinase [Candidatus Synoicihabitans palmerolidicus]|nr:nucleoside monophosphate kinase [Candidatus Synoicihabitans palmerolidicus]